jgi:hypothetical protein
VLIFASSPSVLSIHPVLNNGTTYTTLMSAAQPDSFRTVVRVPPSL